MPKATPTGIRLPAAPQLEWPDVQHHAKVSLLFIVLWYAAVGSKQSLLP